MQSAKQMIDGLMYDGAKVLAALDLGGFAVVPKGPVSELRPFDMHTLHMLGGRATADAAAGLKMSHVETAYLAELVRLAKSVIAPAVSSTQQ